MTELRPYQAKRDAPLTGGARFIRGFTRIGVVIAVLVTLIGVPASVYGAINNYNYAADKRTAAQCIARQARSGYPFKKKYEYGSEIDYSAGGCDNTYSFSYMTASQVMAIADAPAPTFLTSDGPSTLGTGLMITGVLAVIVYVGFWLVGWLCAGFTRDA
jgi:hypothetical protein